MKSINPATGEEIQTYEELTEDQITAKIAKGQEAFKEWKMKSFADRAALMRKAAELLRANARKYGETMAKEMGKPIKAAVAESEKCGLVCDFYADNAEKFLANEIVETDASESFVEHDPMGIILAVMPWNYPFWQAFRAAAPTIMAGNVMLLKHASNVPQCGIEIESIFTEAGFPEGVFQNLTIGSAKVEAIIRDERIKAATLTGSEYAGSQVASQCGKEIKKTVLELGGSDPFIVLADADLDKSCEVGVNARFQNGGQSCIAAKRFIVVEELFDEFIGKYKGILASQKIGDPMDEDTNIGPLATEQIFNDIVEQVDKSVEMGAEIIAGGKRHGEKGFFYEPTILSNVTKGMPVYDQETFGPVSAIIKVKDAEEAIKVANDTHLGLGASLWTQDLDKAKDYVRRINAGAVFVNGMTKSDPRLPFGGINRSGYGRELSHHGIKEFVNAKTVWIA
ncbi:MAG: NAD-dependent succinate-semialdehyde dehydrogenase [bacterium]|nr:NAD-dependent succinate-semialdehyde dehydrogenase [bacterium]